MGILAKDTQVGHVYTSQTDVDYLVQEIHPERIVVMKLSTQEVKADVDPLYEFKSEKPVEEGAVEMQAQNMDQNVPGVAAKAGPAMDENRDPAEVDQPNAGVEPGNVVKDHNPLHPVRRQSPLSRQPIPSRPVATRLAPAPIPAAAPAPAPAAAPAPAKAPVQPPARPAVARSRPAAAQAPTTPSAPATPSKSMAELDAEEQQLLEVRRQADNRIAAIKKLRAEDRKQNDPTFFGYPRLDSKPELTKRLRAGGVPVAELVQAIGQRSFDLFCTKGMRAVKKGEWAEFSISKGLVTAKKAQ